MMATTISATTDAKKTSCVGAAETEQAGVILRTIRKAGLIKVTANADGLGASSILIESRPLNPLPELQGASPLGSSSCGN
jgi:hypothetical protein